MSTTRTLRNQLDQSVFVSWLDVNNNAQTYSLPAKKSVTITYNSLTVETERLLTKGVVSFDTGNSPVVVLAAPAQVDPVGYAKDWAPGLTYQSGTLITYTGSFYITLLDHTSQTGATPDVTTSAYAKFSNSSTDFGVTILTDQLAIKTSGGWKSSLIGDSNVSSLSQSKITGLTTALAGVLALSGGTMTGPIILAADPTSNLQAATKQYADTKVSQAGSTLTGFLVLHADPSASMHPATKQYVDAGDNAHLALSGGTMTGPIVLAADPSQNNHPATKHYVDTAISGVGTAYVPTAGGTMTGFLVLSAAPTANLHPATKLYTDTADNARLSLSGGTMTGPIILAADPSASMHPATKQYVDNANTTKLGLSGGTLTGTLVLSGDPTSNLHAATKQYADGLGNGKLSLSGGTMTGPIVLAADPSSNLHPATKQYADTGDAARLPLAGGTMTGPIVLAAAPSSSLHPATKLYTDTADNARLPLAGGTMTGLLTLSADPTLGLHAATKQYADGLVPVAATQSEAELATEPTVRGFSPLRVGQAIAIRIPTVVKTATEARSSTTTLADDATLQFTVPANQKWALRFIIYRLGGAGGLSYSFTTDSGGATAIYGAVLVGGTSVGYDGTMAGTTTTRGSVDPLTADIYIETGSTPVTVKLQWAQSTSNAAATSILKGSSILARRLG